MVKPLKKIRQEFADTMLEVGLADPNLVVLVGDISHFALVPFAQACPHRFYNVGICEPTIVNMAAGLAKTGFYPVVHTITPFIVERSFEQIKLDFGYQKLGVNIISVGGAFDYVGLGCSHHCYDDFALLKQIEGTQILYPASCLEFNSLFKQTYNNGVITYIRIPEHQHGIDFDEKQIVFGKGILIKPGKNLTIVATGPHLGTVLKTLVEIEKIGLNPEIIYLHTLKPLDLDMISTSVQKTRRCLVIEEHSMYGGLFDDILRGLKDLESIKYAGINIGERFIHEYGTYQEICDMLGFSSFGIIKKIKKELAI